MSDLLKRLENLPPEKRELVLKKLREQKLLSKPDPKSQPFSIEPISRDRPIPLSFAQARLWFLDRLEGESAAYNMPAAIELKGSLDVASLEKALQEIVRRHEVLRTTFKKINDSPVQIIDPSATLSLPIIDLQSIPTTDRSEKLQQLAAEDTQKPFNLTDGPLLRVSLLKLATDVHVLLLNMHHIISDGWSLGIFIHELSTLYQAFCDRRPSPLPNLPIQYADFASWQRQWLSGEVLQKQLDYWQKQLAGIPPILELPIDRPRPPIQTSRGNRLFCRIEPNLTQKLKNLSKKSESTLFMLLLAAFSILLSRYSRQKDIVVGSPIANRNRSEIEGIIGFFVNTLVLRADLEGNPSFWELLKQIRKTSLDAYANQDVPFEQLVEALRPERNLSHTPLFQVMFSLENAPMSKLELPGLTIELLETQNLTAKFDLSLSVEEKESGLKCEWEYNSDLFDPATISLMMEHFQTLLAEIVTDPDRSIWELSLITAAERHKLLVEWNDTQRDYALDKCVHQLFEERSAKTPDKIAVKFEGNELTYRDLNDRANQLARYLQQLGVGPETLVGISIERSLEMVIGLLGILKAGGAYVPLDPAYPQQRLAYMLSDAKVLALLTSENLLTHLPETETNLICLDRDWQTIAQNSTENLLTAVKTENLAYLIYTSGSTGKPKGVTISHRSLLNFTQAAIDTYAISAVDRVLQFASISFDAAVEEIYPCLTCGGTLVLRTQEMLSSVDTFLKHCQDWGITLLDLPTAFWHQITTQLAATELKIPNSVRLVIIGGERAIPETVRTWQNCVGDRPMLVNTYGPTEGTVVATAYKLTAEPIEKEMPIGRPLPNTQTYILDPYLQPVPIGVPGELHIGGLGLARGYLNQPELTQEKFIPNPIPPAPLNKVGLRGDRLYKTGDLVKYLPDGNIEFLGRIDTQVKIRGFRIELGEIEALLAEHPQVREAAIIAREEAQGSKQLVAYTVINSEAVTIADLRQFLAEKLPDYMVPSAFVFLETMPLTPNGKLDRRALPAPDRSSLASASNFVAPRDAVELQLAQIWSNILNIESVGIYDNFFDLGGHSLLAVRLLSSIQEKFAKNLSLTTLFQNATIENLAKVIHSATEDRVSLPLVPIQPTGNRPPFFCVHPGGGYVLCYLELALNLGYEQPLYGLQSPGLDGKAEPFTSIEDMAAAYIAAIETVQPEGPYYIGGWCLGGVVAFEMAQQLRDRGKEVALLAAIESYAPTPINLPSDIDDTVLLAYLAGEMTGLLGHEFSLSIEQLKQLEPDEQLKYILEPAKMLKLLPSETSMEEVRQLLPVFKANSQALCSYRPKPYPGKITLFCAGEELAKGTANYGWENLAAGQLEIIEIQGDHYSSIREPHIRLLSERLKTYLSLKSER